MDITLVVCGFLVSIFGGLTGVLLREFGRYGYQARRRLVLNAVLAGAMGSGLAYGLILIAGRFATMRAPILAFYFLALLVGLLFAANVDARDGPSGMKE